MSSLSRRKSNYAHPSATRERARGFDLGLVTYDGGPNIDRAEQVVFQTEVTDLIKNVIDRHGPHGFRFTAGYGPPDHRSNGRPRDDATETADILPIEPLWKLDQLILPDATMDRLLDCAAFVEVAPLVFDTWDLRSIEPHPSVALNFRGRPGTGKTMAAHAVAHHLGRTIISCRLSDLESKYHGEGPKNIATLFRSAAAGNSVLFIDEAESLLSRRYAQPEQAAESATNSMRTELLMALDSFDGLVIFATNMHTSYDQAIASRLTNVDFGLPDQAARRRLWRLHLPVKLPLDNVTADDLIERLSEIDGITGRDIKMAVISAAVSTARRRLPAVPTELILESLARQREAATEPEADAKPVDLDDDTRARIRDRVDQLHGRT